MSLTISVATEWRMEVPVDMVAANTAASPRPSRPCGKFTSISGKTVFVSSIPGRRYEAATPMRPSASEMTT